MFKFDYSQVKWNGMGQHRRKQNKAYNTVISNELTHYLSISNVNALNYTASDKFSEGFAFYSMVSDGLQKILKYNSHFTMENYVLISN